MRSASQYSFSSVPRVNIQRSAFKRDRTYKTAFNSGYLVPFFTDEVYPGDTFNCRTQAFARLSTPILPFMDNLYMDFFFFYVPYRLLWSHWNNFLGEQDNPDDSTDYLTPILGQTVINGDDVDERDKLFSIPSGSLFDYLGFPVGDFGEANQGYGLVINAFLPRAYNKIWNDHFRDENLQDRVPELTNDGPDYYCDALHESAADNLVNYRLLKRGKRKDYFTSALPWPQKGPGAEIAIASGTAPVFGTGSPLAIAAKASDASGGIYVTGLANSASGFTPKLATPITLYGDPEVGEPCTAATGFAYDPNFVGVPTSAQLKSASSHFDDSGLYADLSTVTPVSINDLRMAFQLQRLMEKNARGGTRVNELILTHFGTVCPDFRLQRSEFLGGGEIPIQIHQVTQTSSTDATSPQGNTAAFGVASGQVHFSKSFVEHGVILGLVSVRADLNYQQGIHRSWTRRGRYDYYWPSLAHLGEQAILNKEIMATGNPAVDDAAFGYQERWAELRYGVSQITGKLRSGLQDSLDVWHLAQYFNNVPQLNSEFIEDNPPVSRVVAVQDEPQIIFDSLTTCSCVRPLPMYSVPGLIDHF